MYLVRLTRCPAKSKLATGVVKSLTISGYLVSNSLNRLTSSSCVTSSLTASSYKWPINSSSNLSPSRILIKASLSGEITWPFSAWILYFQPWLTIS